MTGSEYARISGSYSTAFIGTYQVLSQSTANNTTTFRLRGYFYYGGGTSVSSSYSTFQVNGTNVKTGSYSYSPGYHLLGTKDITVKHNNDGSFPNTSASIYANSYHMSGSKSGRIYANKINRYPILNSGSNFTDESNPVYNITSYNTFPIRIKLEAGGNNQLITRDVPASTSGNYILQLTEAERNTLRALTPNSNTLYVTETVCAMNGNTELNASYKGYAMSIVNANPTFDNFTFEDTNATTVALTGNNQNIIQGYSNVTATIPTNYIASANKYASMNKYSFVCSDAQTDIEYNSSVSTSATINNVKSGVFNVYAIDSRNNSTLVTKNANQTIAYNPLIKENISISRQNGVAEETTLTISGKVDLVDFGQVINSIQESKYRYKTTDSSTWSNYTNISLTVDNNGNFSFNGLIQGDTNDGFDISNSYNIEVLIADKLSNVVFTANLGSGVPNIAIHKDGVGIMGKYDTLEGGALQIKGEDITKYLGETIVEYEFENSTTQTVSFDVDVEIGEWLEVIISGSATTDTDIFLRFNNKSDEKYYSTGVAWNRTSGSWGELTTNTGYRPQVSAFYFGHHLTTGWTNIFEKIGYIKNRNNYSPFAKWQSTAPWDSHCLITNVCGLYYDNNYYPTNKITKVSYTAQNGYFREGTTIKIIKTKRSW